MSIFESKKLDCKAKFISISETVELILQHETDREHIKNALNIKFIKNQTCLHKDGYDLEPIIINNDSTPDYSDIRQAVIDKLENRPNNWLHDYGFGRKRLYSELERLGVFVDDELLTKAKSYFPDDDYQDETGAYFECLPHEYALLHKDYQVLEQKYQDLLDSQNQDMALEQKDLDARTENNLIRALLVVNEWAKDKNGKYLDFSKGYNKNHLDKLNSQLELLGYHGMGETAYKTLIELVKNAKSKGL